MKAILKFFTKEHGYSFIDLMIVTIMVRMFLEQTYKGVIVAVVFGVLFIPFSYYLTQKFGK